jgi:UDP-glucose 4-epimerase
VSIYLVTGANGFIGKALCQYLIAQGATVYGTVRRSWVDAVPGVKVKVTGDINADTDWREVLAGVEVVFHLAGTAHQSDSIDPAIYVSSIAEATLALAKQAAVAKVQRIVYVSSSTVYGSLSGLLQEEYPKEPVTAYGKAKLLAEKYLQQVAQEQGLPVVIVRPPLVYGRTFAHCATRVCNKSA